jgi:hypothetical protein
MYQWPSVLNLPCGVVWSGSQGEWMKNSILLSLMTGTLMLAKVALASEGNFIAENVPTGTNLIFEQDLNFGERIAASIQKGKQVDYPNKLKAYCTVSLVPKADETWAIKKGDVYLVTTPKKTRARKSAIWNLSNGEGQQIELECKKADPLYSRILDRALDSMNVAVELDTIGHLRVNSIKRILKGVAKID